MPTQIIPFTSFNNFRKEDNSGTLEVANNCINDNNGFRFYPKFVDTTNSVTMTAIVTGIIQNNICLLASSDTWYQYFFIVPRGSVTAARFYKYDATTGFIVCTGESDTYSSYVVDGYGDFCQWGDTIIFTDLRNAPYYINVGSNIVHLLGGSPPKALSCCTVNDFILLANTIESGTHYPNRIWNSAINNSSGWTAGTDLCDYDDNPELGTICKIIGGNYATVFATGGIAILRPLSNGGWDMQTKVVHDDDIYPLSIIKVNNLIYYVSRSGIWIFDGNSKLQLFPNKYNFLDTDFNAISKYISYSPYYKATYDSRSDSIIWATCDSSKTAIIYNIKNQEFTELKLDSLTEFTANGTPLTTENYFYFFPTKASNLTYSDGDRSVGVMYSAAQSVSPFYNVIHGYYQNYSSGFSKMTMTLETGYYEFIPNQDVTIKRVTPLEDGQTSEDITIYSYDKTKTAITSKNITSVGGSKLRLTGRFFKFRVNSNFDRITGLKVEYVARGSR